jgi:hypothetical protein
VGQFSHWRERAWISQQTRSVRANAKALGVDCTAFADCEDIQAEDETPRKPAGKGAKGSRRESDMAKKVSGPLPVECRMEVFLAVVDMQDTGVDTVMTRQRIAKRFGVTEHAVRWIEEEELQGEWPPLG